MVAGHAVIEVGWVLAREVTPAPEGWGVVVGGLVLLVGGALLGLQAWWAWRGVDPKDRWRGTAGMFGYMGLLGVAFGIPIGIVLVAVGLSQVGAIWLLVPVGVTAVVAAVFGRRRLQTK
jgi:hypothetical protein